MPACGKKRRMSEKISVLDAVNKMSELRRARQDDAKAIRTAHGPTVKRPAAKVFKRQGADKVKKKIAADKVKKKIAAEKVFKRPAKKIAADKVKPRSIHVEHSINSVLARTGLPRYPRTKGFAFKGPAGLKKARAAAEAWLKKQGV